MITAIVSRMTRHPLEPLQAALRDRVRATSLARAADEMDLPVGVIRAALESRDLKFSSIEKLALALGKPVVITPPNVAALRTFTPPDSPAAGFAEEGPHLWRGAPLPFHGFAHAGYTGDLPSPPDRHIPAPRGLGTYEGSYLIAVGEGMVREGIHHGDVLLALHRPSPEPMDRVIYSLRRGGVKRVARLLRIQDGRVVFRSWASDEAGRQRPVEDEVLLEQIEAMHPVAAVVRAMPGSPEARFRPDPATTTEGDALAAIIAALGLSRQATLPEVVARARELRDAAQLVSRELSKFEVGVERLRERFPREEGTGFSSDDQARLVR